MTLFDWPHGMTVMDGRRLVAKAMPTAAGWRVKLYGACWTHPRSRSRSAVGRPDPAFDVVPTRREAHAILRGLVGFENRANA